VHGSVGKPQDLQRTIGSDCRVMAATVTGPRASFPISLPSDMWTEPTVVFFRAEALSCADNETTGAAGLRLLLGSVGVESPSQLDRPAGYSKYLVEMITNDARILDVYAGSDHVGRLGNLEIVHRGSAYGFQATVEGRFAYSFEAEAHGSAPCSGIIRAAPILREAAPGIAKILRPALAPGPCEGVQVAGTLEASDATLLGRWGFNRAPSVGAWTGSGPDVLISTWTENYIPDPPAVMP
jgi:hypothetical protein